MGNLIKFDSRNFVLNLCFEQSIALKLMAVDVLSGNEEEDVGF